MEVTFFGRVFKIFAEQMQFDKAEKFVESYIMRPAALVALIVIVAYLVAVIVFVALKNQKIKHILADCSPIVYALFILLFSVFNREPSGEHSFRVFDPWISGETSFHESTVIMFFIDLFYFVPLGVLVQWRMRGRLTALKTMGVVLAVGLCVELLQYIFMLGVFTFSNLLSYCLGGGIGCGIVEFLRACRRRKGKK
jgi:glycopeptide antibiotics resistance protein